MSVWTGIGSTHPWVCLSSLMLLSPRSYIHLSHSYPNRQPDQGIMVNTQVPSGNYISQSHLVASMSAPGVPSSSVSSVSSMSSVPSMPSTMPSSMPSSMSSSFSAMPYTSSMPSHSSMPSLTPAELQPMSNMSIPLSQVSPITPFTQPIATGHNVAQLRAASARRNLPQHAGANTVAFRPGSGSRGRSSSSAGRAVVAASVTKKTLIILINPISVRLSVCVYSAFSSR